MKGVVLCNGPSRVKYDPTLSYEFVIGCNIPWTHVDATVILDKPVIEKWHADHSLNKAPVYFSQESWNTAKTLDLNYFKLYYIDIVDPGRPAEQSSGHSAARIMIQKGFKEIDIYGCDSWWQVNTESHTSTYVPHISPNGDHRRMTRVMTWRGKWKEMLEQNPDVKINFIK